MSQDLRLEDPRSEGELLLERIDEYSVYCHYLGCVPELGERILSPIRVEQHPSFQIFESRKSQDCEYMWKDHGINQSGDLFGLVQYMYGYSSKREGLLHIADEFGIEVSGRGLHCIDKGVKFKPLATLPKPLRCSEIEIRILARDWLRSDLDYWSRQGISLKTLDYYRVSPVKYIWMIAGQQSPTTAHSGTYAYRVTVEDKILYKLYQPGSTDHKFRTTYNSKVIEGFEQLRKTAPLLILAKSTKDAMWFRENMGIDAIAGRSESSRVSQEQIALLYSRFPTIISFMDPDSAGLLAAAHYEQYSIPSILLPQDGPKDITDYTSTFGLTAAKEITAKLLSTYGY